MRIRSGYGSIEYQHRLLPGSLGTRALGFGGDLDQNATVSADLPLVARRAELAILTAAIEAAKCGRGEAVLLTGEAGVGKTRLLIETQGEAERRGVLGSGWLIPNVPGGPSSAVPKA
jgi:AAA ATPase-like protein